VNSGRQNVIIDVTAAGDLATSSVILVLKMPDGALI
jgi:hypothetical protein